MVRELAWPAWEEGGGLGFWRDQEGDWFRNSGLLRVFSNDLWPWNSV